LAQRAVPVVLGPVTTQPGRLETWNAVYENAALLAEAGVPFCLQTGSSHNVRTLRFEAGIAVAWGLDPAVALRAVTLDVARTYGLGADYGSLEAGKVANVVVASGDPLQATSRIERVFIRGREVELSSRQTELRDRHAPRTR
jgi:imidazolonepropionase-like amidohydrolase